MCVCTVSHFRCIRLCVAQWTVACQAPLFMEISRQGYWSGLPCSPSGGLPDPGIEPASLSLLHWQFLYHQHHLGNPNNKYNKCLNHDSQISLSLFQHKGSLLCKQQFLASLSKRGIGLAKQSRQREPRKWWSFTPSSRNGYCFCQTIFCQNLESIFSLKEPQELLESQYSSECIFTEIISKQFHSRLTFPLSNKVFWL